MITITNYPINLQDMGNRIRTLRLAKNKTQEIFADEIHISTSYLALIENGKRTASIDILAGISHNLQITMDFLLFGEEAPQDTKNQRKFIKICQQYSANDVEKALQLAEYFLELTKNQDL